jgi:hypothetical protein
MLCNVRFYVIIWCRFLPQKLTGPQLIKKHPEVYKTRVFITAFKTANYLSPF